MSVHVDIVEHEDAWSVLPNVDSVNKHNHYCTSCNEMFTLQVLESFTAIYHLFQMSNEIIRRCCREINLDKILDGHVISGKKSLNDCIGCCEQWKEIYDRVIILWRLGVTFLFLRAVLLCCV